MLPDGVYNESTITVYNHGRLEVPDGEATDITGYAYLTEETGKLLVDFDLGFLGNCKLYHCVSGLRICGICESNAS